MKNIIIQKDKPRVFYNFLTLEIYSYGESMPSF